MVNAHIEHDFRTCKLVPDQPPNSTLTGRYGYAHAAAVIGARTGG